MKKQQSAEFCSIICEHKMLFIAKKTVFSGYCKIAICEQIRQRRKKCSLDSLVYSLNPNSAISEWRIMQNVYLGG
jgi:hypothetical protein